MNTAVVVAIVVVAVCSVAFCQSDPYRAEAVLCLPKWAALVIHTI